MDFIENPKAYQIEWVAIQLGCSTQTINAWYRWKKLHPEHEFAKLLPEPKKRYAHDKRLWSELDIEMLREFQKTIPHGRNGILGDVTQKSLRRKKNGKKSTHKGRRKSNSEQ